jgi:hypothetical protein
MSPPDSVLHGLPGGDLVLRGLDDFAHFRATAEAALIEVAPTRLRALGLPVRAIPASECDAELRLYARLGAQYPDREPYGLYSAWLDQLDSFVSALTHLRERAAPAGAAERRSTR